MLLFCSLSSQSDDPHRGAVPRGRLGALPEVVREGVIDTLLPSVFAFTPKDSSHTLLCSLPGYQFVFRTEPYTGNNGRAVHEELAKALTAILKPSTDFLTSNKLLKVTRRRSF